MVFGLVLEWTRRCFKKALNGNPCTIETQFLHKNVSHIVQFMKMEIQNFFHLFWREKIPENKGELPVFYFESLLRLFQ